MIQESKNINAKLEMAIGGMGSGKTYATIQYAKVYITVKKMPVLIIDKDNEKDYRQFKTVNYDPKIVALDPRNGNEVAQARYKRAFGISRDGKPSGIMAINQPNIYRILCFDKHQKPFTREEMLELFNTICEFYKNGLLIGEEMNSIIRKNITDWFYSFLTRLRKVGVDFIVHYQRLGDPHPDLYGQVKIMRLHYTADSVDRGSIKAKVPDYELVKIGEIVVRKIYNENSACRNEIIRLRDSRPSPQQEKTQIAAIIKKHQTSIDRVFYFLYIDFESRKIRGLTEDDFTEACRVYLNQNPQEIRYKMAEVSPDGKRQYKNHNEAIMALVEEKKEFIK